MGQYRLTFYSIYSLCESIILSHVIFSIAVWMPFNQGLNWRGDSMRYSRLLEENSFANRRADYAWLLFLCASFLLVSLLSIWSSVRHWLMYVSLYPLSQLYHSSPLPWLLPSSISGQDGTLLWKCLCLASSRTFSPYIKLLRMLHTDPSAVSLRHISPWPLSCLPGYSKEVSEQLCPISFVACWWS